MYKLETENSHNERVRLYSAQTGHLTKSRQSSSKRKMTPEKWNIQNAILINFSDHIYNQPQEQKYAHIMNSKAEVNRERKVYKVLRNEKHIVSSSNLQANKNPQQNKDLELIQYSKPEFIINGKVQVDKKNKALLDLLKKKNEDVKSVKKKSKHHVFPSSQRPSLLQTN